MQNQELAQRLQRGNPPTIIDVRSGFEFHTGHIPGAIHLPTTAIPFRKRNIPAGPEELLVVTCEHGPRAQLAAGVLRLFGFKRVELLEGHMSAWRKAGLPVEGE